MENEESKWWETIIAYLIGFIIGGTLSLGIISLLTWLF